MNRLLLEGPTARANRQDDALLLLHLLGKAVTNMRL